MSWGNLFRQYMQESIGLPLEDIGERDNMTHEYEVGVLDGDESQLRSRIHAALKLAWDFGQDDGAHHKQWVISQMVDTLTNGGLADFKEIYEKELPNGDWYEWEEGIAP